MILFLFYQHIQRTFYAPDGSTTKQDSGVWVQAFDYLGLKPIEKIPFYKKLKKFECDGTYCGLPYYYPMRRVLRSVENNFVLVFYGGVWINKSQTRATVLLSHPELCKLGWDSSASVTKTLAGWIFKQNEGFFSRPSLLMKS